MIRPVIIGNPVMSPVMSIGQAPGIHEAKVMQIHRIEIEGRVTDLAPLPHPSGLSTWPRMEPGKTLLQEALQAIEEHPAWQEMLNAA